MLLKKNILGYLFKLQWVEKFLFTEPGYLINRDVHGPLQIHNFVSWLTTYIKQAERDKNPRDFRDKLSAYPRLPALLEATMYHPGMGEGGALLLTGLLASCSEDRT